MQKNNKIVFLVLALIFITSISSAQQISAKFLPPDNKVLLFIGQDRESIDNYSKEMNVVPAGIMFYTSIQTLTGIDEPADHGAGFQDASYLLKEYPDSVLQIGLYMVNALEGVVEGKYDDNITRLGEWFKEIGRPVYLRIGYEFDLPDNHYDPDLYKQAFRSLVDRFRAMGVENVAYVWHSYGVMHDDKPALDWYPGDEYVDWFGVSFFAIYNLDGIRTFAELAKKYNKPLMIAEASTMKDVPLAAKARWERWYQRMFDFVREYDVRAVSYISCDWESFPMWKGQSWGDSRVTTDPFLKEMWLKEVNQERYLRPSSLLFKHLK